MKEQESSDQPAGNEASCQQVELDKLRISKDFKPLMSKSTKDQPQYPARDIWMKDKRQVKLSKEASGLTQQTRCCQRIGLEKYRD